MTADVNPPVSPVESEKLTSNKTNQSHKYLISKTSRYLVRQQTQSHRYLKFFNKNDETNLKKQLKLLLLADIWLDNRHNHIDI